MKNYARLFIAAVLIIASNWKQPKCPSAGEWANKTHYVLTRKNYSARKKEQTPRMNLKSMLSERKQTHKSTH